MAGWIKIYRDIAKHWIFQDAEMFKWWIDMILLASHEDKKTLVGGKLVEFKRGQIIASLSFFSKRWGRSKEKVLNFLKLLESDQMIHRCTDQKTTIITICKYEDYQKVDESTPTDNPTDVRPMSDRCPTETKNVEECKEYIDLTNAHAHTREESIAWEESREREFVQTFVGVGAALPLSKVIGKSPQDVMRLLEVYMASRQLKNLGHKDYRHFLDGFQHAVKNNKISLTAQPQQKKVTGNDETRRLMEEMGWQK